MNIDWLLVVKIVATVFVSVNTRWAYKGLMAEYPTDNKKGLMTAEVLVLILILFAIWGR